MDLTRRGFLVGAAATAVVSSTTACELILPSPSLPSTPFTLGVASGEPRPTSMVLWTRLAPNPLAADGGMPVAIVPVEWELSADPSFATLAASGRQLTSPDFAHSVHVEVDGLSPDTWWWYRFRVGPWTSPIGRTRTTPALTATPTALRLGVASCQHYDQGYYTAHAHLAQENIDAVLFLGDYIYEANSTGPRSTGLGVATTLTDYRSRYAIYKTDPNLQACQAAFPWIVTWDDHEVVNNYAGTADSSGLSSPAFLARRAAAYQAWWEHHPVSSRLLNGPEATIYRSFDWGTLAHLAVLDSRQYRTEYRCGSALGLLCAAMMGNDVTMLGATQESWLSQDLTTSTSRWHLIGQQVMFTPLGASVEGSTINLDQWDGYPAARARLLDVLALPAVTNPVVLTGDLHTAIATDIYRNGDTATPRLGTEIVGTSMTSRNSQSPGLLQDFLRAQPMVRHANALDRGYVVCEFTPAAMTATFRTVSTVAAPVATVANDAVIVVPATP